jgi:hypothetical protein
MNHHNGGGVFEILILPDDVKKETVVLVKQITKLVKEIDAINMLRVFRIGSPLRIWFTLVTCRFLSK